MFESDGGIVQLLDRATRRFWQPIAQRTSATPESRAAIRVIGRGIVIVLLLASMRVILVGAGVGLGVGFWEGFSVGITVGAVEAVPVGEAVMLGVGELAVGETVGCDVVEGVVDPAKYAL
jgi:hypothetical protein